MSVLTPLARIELAERAHTEGHMIQGSWWNGKGNGACGQCFLAAHGTPGEINGTDDFPSEIMPSWMKHLAIRLYDGQSKDNAPWWAGEMLKRERAWLGRLDDAAWERIRTGFMIAAIQQSIDSAAAVQPDPAPDYWPKVKAACQQVIEALQGKGDLAAAGKEAAAARWTAEAEAARWTAARWTAEAEAARWTAAAAEAAEAAEAARWTAEAAAARWTAEAARWTANRKLAESLFALIDAEIGETALA